MSNIKTVALFLRPRYIHICDGQTARQAEITSEINSDSSEYDSDIVLGVAHIRTIGVGRKRSTYKIDVLCVS